MFLKCIVSIFCLFGSQIVFGQYDQEKDFLRHLTKEKLLNEKKYILNSLSDSSKASVLTEKAWTFSKLGNDKRALAYYQKTSFDSVAKLGFAPHELTLLLKFDSLSAVRNLIDSKNPDLPENWKTKFDTSLLLLNAQFPIQTPFPNGLDKAYYQYLTSKRKSLVVATMLSVAVPGLGKMYNNKPRQGFNMLLANLIFGVQALESYLIAGPKSIRFIAFGSLFAAFYTGNIYGTYKGFKKTRHDTYNQLKYEVENFYLDGSGHYPY